MTQETFFLVDGSGFIFRAFYSLPPLTRPDGTPVGAVLGFTNMIIRLLTEMHAHRLVVVFDAGRKTFRNEIYPEYKAHRGETPADLIPQFPLIRQVCTAFDIPMVEKEGFEADDLIATYVKLAETQGLKNIIVSSDKDLMQLVNDQTILFDSMKNTFINKERVRERFGVDPHQVKDVLALMGDSSDNIPGVPGIGPKTASELIQTYGNLESLLASLKGIKQARRQTLLTENAEQARLSLRLVILDDNVPTTLGLEDFTLQQPDPEKVLAFLREQGFKSLESKFLSQVKEGKISLWKEPPLKTVQAIIPISKPSNDPETITTGDQLQEWVKLIEEQKLVAVDTETDSLDATQATLVGVALAVPCGRSAYIPIHHKQKEGSLLEQGQTIHQLPFESVRDILKPLLEDQTILKIGHNIKYDKLVLKKYHMDITPFDDTMLLSYLLEPGRHGLDHLIQHHFHHTMIAFKDIVGPGKQAKTFDEVPLKEATEYAAEDADYTLQLHALLKPQIAEPSLHELYETIDRPLVDVLVSMEETGIKIDPIYLKSLSQEFGKKMAEKESLIHVLSGREFNVGSPKQLAEVLFDHLKIPPGPKGASGVYSTDSDVLESVAENYPIAQEILEWRQLSKLKNTYTDKLPTQINPKTGRIHTSYAMAVTSTGRLASSDPNLQNIPIRTSEGRRIREAFVAAEGHQFISLDYSQIELRLLAHYADIKELKTAFCEGKDIHTLTASQVFGIPEATVTSEMRSKAKAINFGIIYGISAFGLANQLKISRTDAAKYIEAYHTQYPGIKAYMDEQIRLARQQGYVTTLLGRRCYVPNIGSKNPSFRGFAERQAINAPLQGSNADIIKKAMISIHQALGKSTLSTQMLLQVHDELIFEVPDTEIDTSISFLKPLMENCFDLSVPLRVDIGIGKNWAEAK